MLQRVVLGRPATTTAANLPDITARETVMLVPLAVLVLFIGVYPSPLLQAMDIFIGGLVK